MAPVFELLLPEVEDGDGDKEEDGDGDKEEGVATGKPVGLGEVVLVVPGPVVEFVPLINSPGPISGVSRSGRCEAADGKTESRVPTTYGLRFG